jgi:hypothetical protein
VQQIIALVGAKSKKCRVGDVLRVDRNIRRSAAPGMRRRHLKEPLDLLLGSFLDLNGGGNG